MQLVDYDQKFPSFLVMTNKTTNDRILIRISNDGELNRMKLLKEIVNMQLPLTNEELFAVVEYEFRNFQKYHITIEEYLFWILHNSLPTMDLSE
jgi:hypothetical protein